MPLADPVGVGEAEQWKTKYEQLLHTYDEFLKSSKELEEDLESDLQSSQERVLYLTESLARLRDEFREFQSQSEQNRLAANRQSQVLAAQIQALKETNNEAKLKTRSLEQVNESLEREQRVMQREIEDAGERLETAIEEQVFARQEYEIIREDVERLTKELGKSELLVSQAQAAGFLSQSTSNPSSASTSTANATATPSAVVATQTAPVQPETTEIKAPSENESNSSPLKPDRLFRADTFRKLSTSDFGEFEISQRRDDSSLNNGYDEDEQYFSNEADARSKRLAGLALARRQREDRLAKQHMSENNPTESQISLPTTKSGYLEKKEHMLWKTQFFRLSVSERSLEYFVVAQFSDGTNHFSRIGNLRLAGAVLVAKRGIHAGKSRVLQFEITPAHSKKVTVLRAKSEEDLDQWLGAIQLCVADTVPTIEALNFLKNKDGRRKGHLGSRSASMLGGEFENTSNHSPKLIPSIYFSWQTDIRVIKEGVATKLKFGCEGSTPHDWEIVYLRLEEGATVMDYFSVVTGVSGLVPGERRGGIPLVVQVDKVLSLARLQTVENYGCNTNLILITSSPFEHFIQFMSASERMEWVRAFSRYTSGKSTDVRLEGSLAIVASGGEDAKLPHNLYCMLHASKPHPAVLNFFDCTAVSAPVILKTVRLVHSCRVKADQDPLCFELKPSEFEPPFICKAKDTEERQQWLLAISQVVGDMDSAGRQRSNTDVIMPDANSDPERRAFSTLRELKDLHREKEREESNNNNHPVNTINDKQTPATPTTPTPPPFYPPSPLPSSSSSTFILDPQTPERRRRTFSESHPSGGANGHKQARVSVTTLSDLMSRSKSGRLLEMTSNFLGVSWKWKYYFIDAKSRVLSYSSLGKRCIAKNCSLNSDIPGGYCTNCIKKLANGEDDGSGSAKKRYSTSKLNGLVKKREARNDSILKSGVATTNANPTEEKQHTIPLARATVMTLPPRKSGGKNFCFVVTPFHSKRDYILQAADEEEMNEWVEILMPRTKMEETDTVPLGAYLSKRRTKGNQSWRKRWFVLKDNILTYSSSEQHRASHTLILTSSSRAGKTEVGETAPFEFWLNVDDADTYHFLAESRTEGHRWLAAIERAIRNEKRSNTTNSDFPSSNPPALVSSNNSSNNGEMCPATPPSSRTKSLTISNGSSSAMTKSPSFRGSTTFNLFSSPPPSTAPPVPPPSTPPFPSSLSLSPHLTSTTTGVFSNIHSPSSTTSTASTTTISSTISTATTTTASDPSSLVHSALSAVASFDPTLFNTTTTASPPAVAPASSITIASAIANSSITTSYSATRPATTTTTTTTTAAVTTPPTDTSSMTTTATPITSTVDTLAPTNTLPATTTTTAAAVVTTPSIDPTFPTITTTASATTAPSIGTSSTTTTTSTSTTDATLAPATFTTTTTTTAIAATPIATTASSLDFEPTPPTMPSLTISTGLEPVVGATPGLDTKTGLTTVHLFDFKTSSTAPSDWSLERAALSSNDTATGANAEKLETSNPTPPMVVSSAHSAMSLTTNTLPSTPEPLPASTTSSATTSSAVTSAFVVSTAIADVVTTSNMTTSANACHNSTAALSPTLKAPELATLPNTSTTNTQTVAATATIPTSPATYVSTTLATTPSMTATTTPIHPKVLVESPRSNTRPQILVSPSATPLAGAKSIPAAIRNDYMSPMGRITAPTRSPPPSPPATTSTPKTPLSRSVPPPSPKLHTPSSAAEMMRAIGASPATPQSVAESPPPSPASPSRGITFQKFQANKKQDTSWIKSSPSRTPPPPPPPKAAEAPSGVVASVKNLFEEKSAEKPPFERGSSRRGDLYLSPERPPVTRRLQSPPTPRISSALTTTTTSSTATSFP